MARWQPGARERLVVAAVDLFNELGYDATTVGQIAERAGVTKSTFFRHFPDKRELLVAGQEMLSRLLSEGITEAPVDASPLDAVAAGLERASNAMGPMNRELGPRLKAAVAASAELQERDALKSVGLAAAMTAALVARGVPELTAQLAAELGVLAFKRGYAEWSEGHHDLNGGGGGADDDHADDHDTDTDTDNRDTDNRDTDDRDKDNRDTDNRDTDNRDTDDPLAPYTLAALADLRTASAGLT